MLTPYENKYNIQYAWGKRFCGGFYGKAWKTCMNIHGVISMEHENKEKICKYCC